MTAYDPALCERLIAEARAFGDFSCGPSCSGRRDECPTRIAGDWAVDNLSAMADQLEAAKREVERLTKHNNEVACALGVEGEPDATVAHTAWEARGLVMAGAVLRTERDALRAEVERLRRTSIGFIPKPGDRVTLARMHDAAPPVHVGDLVRRLCKQLLAVACPAESRECTARGMCTNKCGELDRSGDV